MIKCLRVNNNFSFTVRRQDVEIAVRTNAICPREKHGL